MTSSSPAPMPPTIVVRRRFQASAERVFDAWLNPDHARKWLFCDGVNAIASAQIDARVGGRFSFVRRSDEGDLEHVGEYLEIDRPRRLVFTFAVPALSPDHDRVIIDITPLEEGCELVLTSQMTPEIFAQWGEQTQAGWTKMLDGLARTILTGGRHAGSRMEC